DLEGEAGPVHGRHCSLHVFDFAVIILLVGRGAGRFGGDVEGCRSEADAVHYSPARGNGVGDVYINIKDERAGADGKVRAERDRDGSAGWAVDVDGSTGAVQ